MFRMKRPEQLPLLVAIERRGVVLVLQVRTPAGEDTRVYCGPSESFNPCLWTWTRNGVVRPGRGDPEGFAAFTEADGREYQFAVGTVDDLARFREIVGRPLA